MTVSSPAQPKGRQTAPGTPAAVGGQDRPVKLIKHYDLVYWWVVWLYAALAWAWTSYAGKQIVITDKALRFATEPMLGIGFLAVLLFVAIFTAIRARGAMSAILVAALIIIGLLMHFNGWWGSIMQSFPDLRVHMNQAFYAVVFCVLFPVWVLTTFVFNRLHYYTFDHGKQVGDCSMIGGGSRTFAANNIALMKQPDDIFVHRVLGLWWLGFGTGDVVLTYTEPGGGSHREIINNVWQVDRKIREINRRIQ